MPSTSTAKSPVTEHRIPLSPIDETIIRNYTRTVTLFPFSNQYLRSHAAERIESAFQATLTHYPYLAGTVQRQSPPGNPQRRSIHYTLPPPTVRDLDLFRVVDLSSTYPHTYPSLRAAGFPSSAFPPSTFHFFPEAPDPSSPAPILGLQVSFFTDGLALAFYSHHSVLDGTGRTTFLSRLAANLRSGRTDDPATGPPAVAAFPTPTIPAPSALPEFRIASPGEPFPASWISHPSPPPSRILTFAPATVTALKKSLNAHSTFDALTALICVSMSRARYAAFRAANPGSAEEGKADVRPRFGLVLDVRGRADPPLPKGYIGNAALYTFATGPTFDSMMSDAASARAAVAKAIRGAIEEVDGPWVSSRLAFLAAAVARGEAEHVGCGLDCAGTDIMVTSWAGFSGGEEWSIPGAGSVGAVRKPWGPVDGGVIFLPRVPGGGVEVMEEEVE
ncbi:hypothetical protein EJ06DRAFT_546631 [Trichodelitschia bisporula]|uniref:Trichothecene 3-O-acetyltransferase-like N-terminal domain-containing protein n=1 Tax=Trichodelitschia bisporula TaxID=703511 RepID=A0A6G1I579_9PEZI|nr:hypothetical protein EJ06DRAFT_546631 [Trichodelitschia bisporula]